MHMLQPVVRGKFAIRGRKRETTDPEDIFNGLHKIPDLLEELKTGEEQRKKEHADKMKQLDETIAAINKTQRGPRGDKGETPVVGVHFKQPRDGKDGRNGKDGERGQNGKSPIAAEVDYKKLARMVSRRMPKSEDAKQKIPTAKEIIVELKKLPAGERLSLDDLDNTEAKIRKFWERYPKGMLHGGGDSVAAGSGVTITTNAAGQKVISAAGAGLSIIAVSGTIDDSNMNFTATKEPTLLNINGSFYTQVGGNITWTYSGGNITLSSPVGTNGSIFGI